LKEGVRVETIDNALTKFGFPVGPITLIDEVGIDVGMHVLETIEKAFPDRMTPPKGFSLVTENGKRLGRKTNKGFYHFVNGKKDKVDDSVYALLGVRPDETPRYQDAEIAERLVMLFVNESVRCLEESVLAAAYDGDVGAVFGLGFPPFLGGPFKYVDLLGASVVVEKLRALESKFGTRFTPSPLLVKMASGQERFFPKEPSRS
jgi:3-hydroxyacyl-CoA dehydrogenase/enoyl-CoA hydratase/3-hydroxybutyryl-CoA epimerase